MSKLFTRASVTQTTLSGASLKGLLATLWDAMNSRGFSDVARTTVTSTSTLQTTQCGILLVDCSGGSIVLTAPLSGSASDDAEFKIRRIDTDYTKALTFVPNGASDTVEGVNAANGGAVSIPPQGAADIQLPGGATNWRVTKLSGGTAQGARDIIGTGALSFRNRARNGRMDLAQRGASLAAIASGSYSLDGWKRLGSGAQVVTHSQQANSNANSDFQNVLRVAVTTANAAPGAGDYESVTQPIEGYLVRDLVGNPIAIRFEVKSPKTGTHCVSLCNNGNDRSYILTYNVAVANTAQVVTLALPAGLISAGTWNFTTATGVQLRFCLMAGTTMQAAAGAWQVGNFYGTSAQVNCMDTVGNTFEVTGVQLERAIASTPFEHREFELENAFNQRYYAAGFFDYLTYQGAGQGFRVALGLPVLMRATPSMASSGASYLNASGVTFVSVTAQAFSAGATATALGACQVTFNWTASAEL